MQITSMTPPKPPNIEGLKPEFAAQRLAEHQANEERYMDYLLTKRAGALTAQDRTFIAFHIRRWEESGRPTE